jgi:NADPH-dependent 2,4-dienoyl-CoA reductase/sulfur reductase-like enzyme/ferredoxin
MAAMNGAALPVFPNYTQLPSRVPLVAWHVVRALGVAAAIGIAVLLVVRPEQGLFLLWQLVIPVVPAVFLVAPGLWRNACPLAALNQLPRLAGFTKGLAHTPAIREYSFVVGIVAFFALVSARKFLFNGDGLATAVLIFAALGLAFLGGVVFKGKSGWCSSVCPMLPVQRLYGQTPFVTVPNSHCRPCVGCTKNCYDFNPKVAYLADQYDDDRRYVGYRRFFAAVFPGFVAAFYLVPDPPAVTVPRMYFEFAAYMAVSLAAFTTLETFAKVRANTLTALFAVIAFNVYYWFSAATFVGAVSQLAGASTEALWVWAIRGAVLAVTAVWLVRTLLVERRFVALSVATAAAPAARLGEGAAVALEKAATRESAQVTFKPEGKRVAIQPGQTLLAIAESCGLQIESGCRMGICGADPVAVLEGMGGISPLGEDERATLARLGLADNTRLACCARVNGPVTVSLTPQRRAAAKPAAAPAAGFDPAVQRVVVIGHGIAGVTAADHVRRLHPDCELTVVGKEKFPLYNRMGITRLIYGRSAMQGLYLLPDAWYAENNISCWLNTRAARIDPAARAVTLATGDELPYDRLILATGSTSYVPSIPGFGAAGTFVLREAEDAMYIRAYAQDTNARTAVVAGGGLLGLEAAYALLKLGLRVTVLERGRWPLQRQVDEHGGMLLRDYLAGLGIQVFVESEVARLGVEDALVKEAVLRDARALPCDVFLVCAGIRPNVALAKDAGLDVNRGIVVDNHLRASAPYVYAVGDAAEFRGEVYGLWPACVEQGQIAAANAVGGDREYAGTIPSTILKVVGADLASMGRIAATAEDQVVAFEDPETRRYAKLVVAGGKIAGAILLGFPKEAGLVAEALKSGRDVTGELAALRVGDWSVLEPARAEAGASEAAA